MAPAVAAMAASPLASFTPVASASASNAARHVSLASFSGLKRADAAPLSATAPLRASFSASGKPATSAPSCPSAVRPRASASAPASAPRKILMMGGTRFIGVHLARLLVKAGHEVTLFTRGRTPVTQQLPDESASDYSDYCARVRHLKGDRKNLDALREALKGADFDVVYDINGREAAEVAPILDALPNLEQYIFCSSAGVYLKSDELPHKESDPTDPKSRHKGKLDVESLLAASGTPWTSVRPVYIFGPLNYNPVEEWFFHRLKAGRPIPVPSSGMQVTQLGHVKDLARAFHLVLGHPAAQNQIFNLSGPRFVTFDRIACACADAMGVPRPLLVHYEPKEFDFGKNKAFPLRNQHFFASNEKAEQLLGWRAEFGLVDGLKDSYTLDFARGTHRAEPNFTTDDMILERLGVEVNA